MADSPLTGVRILDMTSVLVGPAATQMFADYGADVIKLEGPEGDVGRTVSGVSKTGEQAPRFLAFNRRKRSIVVDLKRPEARPVLERLVAAADIFVSNVRPSALRRLGLAYEDAARLRPDIIYCSIVGFGQDGPYRGKPVFDSIIQGAAGVTGANERFFGEQQYTPLLICDHVVGLIATSQISLALLHREKTGRGQSIEVPMFENMAAFVLSQHLAQSAYVPPRGPIGDPRVLNPLTAPVPTKDGHISIATNSNKQAFALLDAIGRPELKTDPRFATPAARARNLSAFCEIRNEGMRGKTAVEWMTILDALDVPAMVCHSLEGVLDDEHLKAVSLVQTAIHPEEGAYRYVRPANRFSDIAVAPFRAPPMLGQDTRDVLGEIGYDSAAIDQLAADGIVVCRTRPA